MTLIDTFDFPQYKFSLYFLTTLPQGESDDDYTLTPGTQAAHDYLWNMPGVALELTHNHGTEATTTDDDKAAVYYHPGNQERDGFGHIAVRYVLFIFIVLWMYMVSIYVFCSWLVDVVFLFSLYIVSTMSMRLVKSWKRRDVCSKRNPTKVA
jgi:hypothetical protein